MAIILLQTSIADDLRAGVTTHQGISAVVDEPPTPPDPSYPERESNTVRCPECGCDDAIVVHVHFDSRGCFCPECDHSWNETVSPSSSD